jgi:hypothetical protein
VINLILFKKLGTTLVRFTAQIMQGIHGGH